MSSELLPSQAAQADATALPRLAGLPLWCGHPEGGVDEIDEFKDWSHRETTPDQQRIEEVLARLDLRGRSVLHIGIGNSSLASRFHQHLRFVQGVTIQPEEALRASRLALFNYNVLTASKYQAGLPARLSLRYDVIVDNNPTTFCCCREHLVTMLESYRALLAPGGIILTDSQGLGWTSTPNDSRWAMQPHEWFALGRLRKLEAHALTEQVIALKKTTGWQVWRQAVV